MPATGTPRATATSSWGPARATTTPPAINNTFLGYLSGQNADATASNNLYVGSQGAPGESGTIRVGDPANQTAAYMAGVKGVFYNLRCPGLR